MIRLSQKDIDLLHQDKIRPFGPLVICNGYYYIIISRFLHYEPGSTGGLQVGPNKTCGQSVLLMLLRHVLPLHQLVQIPNVILTWVKCHLPPTDYHLPTANCQMPTAIFQLSPANSHLPSANCHLRKNIKLGLKAFTIADEGCSPSQKLENAAHKAAIFLV